jgi:hypothetical protein
MTDAQALVATEKEAAAMYNVTPAAMRKWRREGRGPAWVHLGRCVRYPVAGLQAHLEQCAKGGKQAEGRS